MTDFTKAYNPKETEEKIYKLWEESGFFNPDKLPTLRHGFAGQAERKPFSIVLPPPNVTGVLHMGSALMLAIQDIMIRFERMRGKKTLWLPGTDHAAIATETKFLKEKKISRRDYEGKRDEFVRLVDEYARGNQSVILEQMRAMGASLDWSRLKYTFDEEQSAAVREAFIRMWDAGIIYRAEKIINWDSKGQTAVSDDEIEYETRQTTFYTFRYSRDFPIAIGTTRPETKVGDTAVAVHPSDTRYRQYIGKEIHVEDFAGVALDIKVVGDESVDPSFGTGALGVTPAHSKIDEAIAMRHGLPSRQVINEFDRMNEQAGIASGQKTAEARERIVQWLRENKLLEKEETIEHNFPKAQRSGGLIEQLPKSNQLFINVSKPITQRGGKTLKELMREPVADGRIKILPERFEKIYFHWIDNLRDWNISRQIWYGHQIPLWHRNGEIYCGAYAPKDAGWTQETDTLDTWFSSGLWTFSTLGWPSSAKASEGKPNDLKTYHPTDVLETGYDILFFWIARMILMSQFLLGDIPFKTVYLHGLVRDEKGRKISKSLGNNIDPIAVIDQYGADAVRMAMIVGTSAGNDSRVSPEKFKAYKHFANKLWNIARYVLGKISEVEPWDFFKVQPQADSVENEIIIKTKQLAEEITKDMESYKFYLAAEKLYHFVWHEYADKYIESTKDKNDSETLGILYSSFVILLKLLHPFMPFITEEIWTRLPQWDGLPAGKAGKKLLIVEDWPSET